MCWEMEIWRGGIYAQRENLRGRGFVLEGGIWGGREFELGGGICTGRRGIFVWGELWRVKISA